MTDFHSVITPDDVPDRNQALARYAIDLGAAELTAADHQQLARLVLDHLACCYRGACSPWGKKMRQWADVYAGNGQSHLFADGRNVPAATAAFVNATAAHGLELDDTHDESVSHPGAAIISTAIALAAQTGKGGSDLLTAITVGYEVTGRVGAATNAARIIELGFHPTSLFVGFGVTATAARLLGLDARQLCGAWGLMLSMAGGSMQFSQEAEGTTVKRLHGGYAALHGVLAAEHAALDIMGPPHALDGRYGLLANFGEQQDPDRLTTKHANGPEIHRISFKPYPCCRLFHSTLDALIEVTDGLSLAPERIAKIRVGGPEIMVSQHMLRRPESEMAAQYSLPFTLGAALYFGPESVDGFMAPALRHAGVLAVADRVEAQLSPTMEEAFPAHFGSWLELTTTDGQVRRSDVLDSLGTPARPMNNDALIRKFDSLMQPTGSAVRGQPMAEQLSNMGQLQDLTDLFTPFFQPANTGNDAEL